MCKSLFILWRCYFKSLKLHRTNTIMGFLNIIVNQIVTCMFLFVIINNIPELNGWEKGRLISVYGIFTLNKGVSSFFTSSLFSIERHIKEGSFDGILVRPVSPIIQILGEKLEIGEIMNVSLGIGVLAYSFAGNAMFWINMLLILPFTIFSILLVFSIRLASMSIAFWTLTSFPITIAIDNFSEFARYPSTIYSRFIRVILDYVLPFAVLAFYPALVIYERKYYLMVIAFLLTCTISIISSVVWRGGIRKYKSSGH